MTITALPSAPTRADPANFAARADAMFAALPPFVAELNAFIAGLPSVVAGQVNGNFQVQGYLQLGGRGTAYAVRFYDFRVSNSATNRLVVDNYAQDILTLTANGCLGIGCSPSPWSGAGNVQLPATSVLSTVADGIHVGSNLYYASGWRYAANGAASLAGQSGGAHVWYRVPNGTADDPAPITEVMRIDAAGNLVPILTTSVPALAALRSMAWTLISDTSLRISVRGSDGVLRSATIALA